MEIPFEFMFSYWIIAWFLFYYFGFTQFNPKIMLILLLIENIVMGLYLNKYNSTLLIRFYIFFNIILKLVLIWILRNTDYRWKDVKMSILSLISFLSWMLFRLGSTQFIFNYYKKNINKFI